MKSELTCMERLAKKTMRCLRWNEEGYFYPCWTNDMVLNIACVLLGGRDPIEWECAQLVKTTGLSDGIFKPAYSKLR